MCSIRLISSRSINKLTSFSTLINCSPKETLDTKTCIELLKTCKSITQLKQIHAQVIILNFHKRIGILHKLLAFTTDTLQGGDFNYAKKIFTYCHSRTLFMYNVMIKGYVKNGQFKQPLFLFDELRIGGLCPDSFTYPFVFKAIGELKMVKEGEKIHGYVLKSGVWFDNYVGNSVMDMYGLFGCVTSLNKVFDEMTHRDSVAWNILISGFVRCGRYGDAVGVYMKMREKSGVKPDEATIVSTLSACTALKSLELGKEIHRYVVEELGFSVIIGNALVDMYSKCGFLMVARQIFDDMPTKNVICWTSMVSGYVNRGQLDEAGKLFERSPVRDLVLWTTMINGYVQFNRVDDAMNMFRTMQMQRIKPDKYTLVALLTGCAQIGAFEQGEWIRDYMKENKIAITAVVGTALIEMYAKCGCIEKSMEIFDGLKEKDTASWTSIICALAMSGNTKKALELFSQMEQGGFCPDDITFIGVLSACSHGGLVEEGRRYFHSMSRIYGIQPKLEHYGCLIDLLGRAGLLREAEETISMIPKKDNEIIIPIYGALLSACRIYGSVDVGERVAKLLMEIESYDSSTHTLLANTYASAGRWEDVSKVRGTMRDLGVKKSPGCSSIDVNANVYEFIVGH
ncbi:pentatricopeptide repeat-containing protein At1g31430-like [Nicotiana tabacum]|uniref:Pentatricopeptide repeat-containing protein At1g31430-like n=1 Tax=Nicotiana tabacum TaxID=4097 RepID=A0A1S3XY11_TOBAC|nr:pentatricopeptide repeat-containing protein At1g31430 [Nicotiana tomentosiformis]XP_016444602.1 PREDICTED: pentatricopeptide repeat-containing protein At1g31430-like [Nicotiana tabacum]